MTSSSSPNEARATLGRLELRCPPLPQTLVQAASLIDDPEQLEVGPVTAMVQRDPIVVAKLLHIVNSAYYGLRSSINSVERAVVMLGPVGVTGIVVGMNMMRLNAVLEGSALSCFDRLIRHSIATAFLARHLVEGVAGQGPAARSLPVARVGVSFTAGLLHDFGKIILTYNAPETAGTVYGPDDMNALVTDLDPLGYEQLVFGFDHLEAGEFVARKLNFPDILTDVIRSHHEPVLDAVGDQSARLTRMVAAADLAAKAFGHGIAGDAYVGGVDMTAVWTAVAELDFPGAPDAAAIVAVLEEQRPHLDAYVDSFASAPSRSER